MTQPSVIRLLIADDNDMLRAGLRTALDMFPDIALVGEAATGEEAIEQCEALQPDVILMDMRMPGMTGMEATRIIRVRYPAIRIIALTSFDDPTLAREMDALGSRYLFKSMGIFELVEAIRAV